MGLDDIHFLSLSKTVLLLTPFESGFRVQLRTSTLEGKEYGPGAGRLGSGLPERLLGRR